MTWDILILTMPTRKDYLNRLLKVLRPQVQKYPEVAILIRTCNPLMPLGENREFLRCGSLADYISFVDDDDLVASDYVSRIHPLLDGVDQIGFEVEVSVDGIKSPKRDIHSLREPGWFDTPTHFNRDISHLNPMRRELALLEPMEGGHGEDSRWSSRMRGKVHTEHYIDAILYYYLFRTRKDRAEICPRCASPMTCRLETESHCNKCGNRFNPSEPRKSCLWD